MDINDFIKNKLKPTENEINVLQNTLNSVTSILRNDSNISVAKVFPAGSFAKGTMLRGNFEADIVYIVNKDYKYDELIEYVFKLIKGNFSKAKKITNPHKSVKLEIEKPIGLLEFDILPAFEINSPKQLSEVKNQKYFAGSSTKFHLEYIKQQKKVNSSFGNIIRVLKYWANLYSVPLTGFQIELLVAHGINGQLVKNWNECLVSCYKSIQAMSNGKIISLVNWKYFNENDFTKEPIYNAWIIDPGNPKNNVAGFLSKEQVKEIGSKAHKAIDIINKLGINKLLKIE